MAATEAKASRLSEAGHSGKDIRSDLHVAFVPRDRGEVEIALESRVKPYYGDAIEAQARKVLSELGVKHGHLAIHDEGALPFVIAARIEAAVRRGGRWCKHRARPATNAHLPP